MQRREKDVSKYQVMTWIVGTLVALACIPFVDDILVWAWHAAATWGSVRAAWFQAVLTVLALFVAIIVPWQIHRRDHREQRVRSRNEARAIAMRIRPLMKDLCNRYERAEKYCVISEINPVERSAKVFRSQADADSFRQSLSPQIQQSGTSAPTPFSTGMQFEMLIRDLYIDPELFELSDRFGFLDAAAFPMQRALVALKDIQGSYELVWHEGLTLRASTVAGVQSKYERERQKLKAALVSVREAVQALDALFEAP